jgi:uncharacterized protein (TIGR02147 family)
MKTSIFDFSDYKAYLMMSVDSLGKGARMRLAKVADCQPGYVTHVLGGNAHFSLEQAEKINHFLGHNEEQSHYFLLLISYGRAGSDSLRRYYKKQIEDSRENRSKLKNRIPFQKMLSVENQSTFYSSWHYAAFHVAASIPGCNSERGLAEYFDIPLAKANEIVSFLLEVGILKKEGAKLKVGPSQVFLGSDSPLISKLHSNWRLEALKSLDRYTEKDLHYSSVISASYEDVAKIREILIESINQIRAVVKPSKDEACFVYNLDLFKLGGLKK